GGFIATYWHWRWIFWINVPVGVIGLALALAFVPRLRAEAAPPFDRAGFALSGLGLSGLLFGFSVIGHGQVPPQVATALIVAGAVLMGLYLLHYRRAERPILDFSLLRFATFRASITGGFAFRIAVGAIPFLLPLMLQLGLGMTAFQSGSLTFLSTIGALTMKFTVGRIVRRFGFRPVLVANGILSAGFVFATGAFALGLPHWVMIAVLLVSGFFRSLQFTCINVVAYADVPDAAMSRATSLASVAQQVSLSCGVAIGALVLETLRAASPGHVLQPHDFFVGFMVVGASALIAPFIFARLPRDAGAHMAAGRGHAA
ncbi:MFS transporter, partial [Pseudoxanthobacter sp.]|uniref:MFS transporter n=1 Tax=Pseudoxanthobacter sp. TaxID=1925742 RepID=UPI002FE17B19